MLLVEAQLQHPTTQTVWVKMAVSFTWRLMECHNHC